MHTIHTHEALLTEATALERQTARIERLMERRGEYLARIDWTAMHVSELEKVHSRGLDLEAHLWVLSMQTTQNQEQRQALTH